MRNRSSSWLLFALAVLLLGYYAGSSMWLNGGELVPPLDDTFIHFQYARRIAEGAPFSYQAGDPYTSGATSLVWPPLLAVGWRLGFTDTSLYIWALGLATGLLAATAALTRTWLTRVSDPRTGWLGALLLLTCGPLLWGAFSGMEVILFCAAIAGVLEGITRPDRPPGLPARWTLTWAGLLATVRPEGAVLAGVLAAVQIVEAWLAGGRRVRAALPALVWLLPVALGGLQPLLNLVNTGVVGSASALAKQGPRFTRPEDHSLPGFILDNLIWRGVGAQFFGGLAPFALTLFGVGAAALLLRDHARGRPGVGTLGLLWWVLPLLLVAAMLPLEWHHYRYLMPYLAIFLPIAAIGADRIDHAVARLRGPPGGPAAPATPFVLGAFLALSAFGGLAWADVLARNARDIREQHVTLGRWLAANIPEDAVVAVNDVGAITYLGRRRVYDLEGIVSRDALPAGLAGEGSAYEALLRVAPNLVVVYPSWFMTMVESGALTIRSHTRLTERSIAGASDMVVATLDPAVTGTQDRPPTLAPGERVVDTLDVSDLADEAAHTFTIDDPTLAAGRANKVLSGVYEDGTRVIDSARRVASGGRFTIDRGAGPATLVGRFGPSEAASRLRVRVDGVDAGTWTVRAVAAGTWADQRFELPAGTGVVRVELVPESVAAGPREGWNVARLWAVSSTFP